MKELIFKGVQFKPELRPGQGWEMTETPFEMRCVQEKECIAVAPDGLHCWVKFSDDTWRYAHWTDYRVDSVEEVHE